MPVYRIFAVCLAAALLCVGAARTTFAGEETENWPVSLEEAVSRTVDALSDKDKATLAGTQKNDLILYHHGWGTSIRNAYGLWGGNEALLRSACGGTLCHPDDASMIIIEKVWERVRKE